jgi:amino-acid N-acetyltransferase
MYDRILFVDGASAPRAQLAECLARELFGRLLHVQSAITDAAHVPDPALMNSLDIDITASPTRLVSEIAPENIDAVIVLSAKSGLPPRMSSIAQLHWDMPEANAPDEGSEQRASRAWALRQELRCHLWSFASANAPRGISLGAAAAADLPAIEALIRASELPLAVVHDRFPDAYAVARRDREVVGVAAIEPYGRTALLRSVAIAQSERGRGTGIALVAERLVAAMAQGIEDVWLLTTTAAPYFHRFGFADVARGDAPPELRASPEFAAICPASATCMRVDVTRGELAGSRIAS